METLYTGQQVLMLSNPHHAEQVLKNVRSCQGKFSITLSEIGYGAMYNYPNP